MLRPPGVADFGAPLEEPQDKALGARMASHNGYANIPGYGLYDATGGTEDWTFWTAGSLGYTFEIGLNGFHPAYNDSVSTSTSAAARRPARARAATARRTTRCS